MILEYDVSVDPKYRNRINELKTLRTERLEAYRQSQRQGKWSWTEDLERDRERARTRHTVTHTVSEGHLRDPGLQKLVLTAGHDEEEIERLAESATVVKSFTGQVADDNTWKSGHREPSSHIPKRLIDRDGHPVAKEIQKKRERLPSYLAREQILTALRSNQVIVITGGTGCGKTTQIPQYILDDLIAEHHLDNSGHDGLNKEFSIVCTQPRRISTISVANRVAEERMERAGHSIGWMIRYESSVNWNLCRLLFCTTGMVLQRLRRDPTLQGTTHLIIDEVHERSLETDILLTHVKAILEDRKDLRVILMSATVNTEKFSAFFYNCPVIHIEGRSYDVEILHLEDLIASGVLSEADSRSGYAPQGPRENPILATGNDFFLNYANSVLKNPKQAPKNIGSFMTLSETPKGLAKLIAMIVRSIVSADNSAQDVDEAKDSEDGASKPNGILVFLPGWDYMQKAREAIRQELDSQQVQILMLHSNLPPQEQQKVFEPATAGRRKVILTTNVAETSITIDDVVCVIDSGLHNQRGYESSQYLASLGAEWIPKSSAEQRAGRAGRVRPGRCIRLYTKAQFDQFQDFPIPEIRVVPLENVVLDTIALGQNTCADFLSKSPDPPMREVVESAIKMLRRIGACEADAEAVTPLGAKLALLPIHPQLGKMLLMGGFLGCIQPLLTIVSCYGVDKDLLQNVKTTKTDFFGFKQNKVNFQRRNREELVEETPLSDFAILLHLYNEWRSVVEKRANEVLFAKNYGVQLNVMQSVHLLRKQLESTLSREGFESAFSDDFEGWRDDIQLAETVAAGCLFPNLARADQAMNREMYIRGPISTRSEREVEIVPNSLLSSSRKPLIQHWLAFHKKIKIGDRVRLSGVGNVSPQALMLFSNQLLLRGALQSRFCLPNANNRGPMVDSSDDAEAVGRIRRAFRKMSSLYFDGQFFPKDRRDHLRNMRKVFVRFLMEAGRYTPPDEYLSDVLEYKHGLKKKEKVAAEGLYVKNMDSEQADDMVGVSKEEDLSVPFWRKDLSDND